jgi:hypothetical protein
MHAGMAMAYYHVPALLRTCFKSNSHKQPLVPGLCHVALVNIQRSRCISLGLCQHDSMQSLGR